MYRYLVGERARQKLRYASPALPSNLFSACHESEWNRRRRGRSSAQRDTLNTTLCAIVSPGRHNFRIQLDTNCRVFKDAGNPSIAPHSASECKMFFFCLWKINFWARVFDIFFLNLQVLYCIRKRFLHKRENFNNQLNHKSFFFWRK